MPMKPIRLGVLMDDISSIKPHKDSTFAMMLEAQARHWEIYTFDSSDMYYSDGKVIADSRKTLVNDSESDWHSREDAQPLSLGALDAVFMRKDPPFDMDYIYATYLLEQLESDGVLVVNKPSSLRDANEKLFALNFPECIPKTLVSSNIKKLNTFINEIKTVVVKPLDGYALARLPAEGSFKGNLAAGAKGVGQPLSERDRYLCSQIAPILIKKELMFVGLDVIGDYITEINVTSPTCIRELDKQFGLNISATLLDEVENRLSLR